ncbi:MAG: cyclopropane-fatty-acyl-phospholipid synthase family protein [Pseudomonadota bacterium]
MTTLWKHALHKALLTVWQHGSLNLVMPDGKICSFGKVTSASLTVRLHTDETVRRLVLNPDMALGEVYMDGTLTIDGDDLQGFLALLFSNLYSDDRKWGWWQEPFMKACAAFQGLSQGNVIGRARRNVAHHYDLSGDLYDLFLDDDRQYSCAYFRHPAETLEAAQENKKRHIARKLMIAPNMRLLDIGCGWGGMALMLARDYGARVTGITLSKEQHAYAVKRAKEEKLSNRVAFRLADYREVEGNFDRIVSVGMFEHVGKKCFGSYFSAIRSLLKADGIALIHTIGCALPPRGPSPWIDKYIFPGGYIPSVSEVMQAVENEALWATDIECWRLHYAYTLRHWYDRFVRNEEKARALYDERFIRMWRFYLAACEQTFRHNHLAVFQFQLAKAIDQVPIRRDYLYGPSPHRLSERAPLMEVG